MRIADHARRFKIGFLGYERYRNKHAEEAIAAEHFACSDNANYEALATVATLASSKSKLFCHAWSNAVVLKYKRRSAAHEQAELQKDVVDSERERQKTSCSASENTPSFNTLEKKKTKSCTVQTMMMMTTTTTTQIITKKEKTRTREKAKEAILRQLHRRQAAI